MAGDEIGVPVEVRFWSRVDKTGDCWNWTGHVSGGYGRIRVGASRVQAHRFSYELAAGPVADGLHLDHLCRNQRCVNPAHLKPVTPRENTLRGIAPSAQQAKQVECARGHSLSGENVRWRGNKRECRTCALQTQRERRVLKRDEINAQKRAWYARTKAGV